LPPSRIWRWKKPASDFAKSSGGQPDIYYDLEFDKSAIEASFAGQYGIRLSREDMTVGEFFRLLSGLMPDTPLGLLVAARMTANPQTPQERQIKREWGLFKGGQGDVEKLQQMLAVSFG